jgi:hypothetical protein
LSGVQTKLGITVKDGHFCFCGENERSTFMLKPHPTSPLLLSKEDCPANENLTMQIAEQVYQIETARNALCFLKMMTALTLLDDSISARMEANTLRGFCFIDGANQG